MVFWTYVEKQKETLSKAWDKSLYRSLKVSIAPFQLLGALFDYLIGLAWPAYGKARCFYGGVIDSLGSAADDLADKQTSQNRNPEWFKISDFFTIIAVVTIGLVAISVFVVLPAAIRMAIAVLGGLFVLGGDLWVFATQKQPEDISTRISETYQEYIKNRDKILTPQRGKALLTALMSIQGSCWQEVFDEVTSILEKTENQSAEDQAHCLGKVRFLLELYSNALHFMENYSEIVRLFPEGEPFFAKCQNFHQAIVNFFNKNPLSKIASFQYYAASLLQQREASGMAKEAKLSQITSLIASYGVVIAARVRFPANDGILVTGVQQMDILTNNWDQSLAISLSLLPTTRLADAPSLQQPVTGDDASSNDNKSNRTYSHSVSYLSGRRRVYDFCTVGECQGSGLYYFSPRGKTKKSLGFVRDHSVVTSPFCSSKA